MSELPFPALVALRYLRSKRKEVFISIITLISILGVAVSVSTSTVTYGVNCAMMDCRMSPRDGVDSHADARPVISNVSG